MKIINLIYLLIPLSVLFSLPVNAGQYKLIYEDKITGYSIADSSGVCKAYEKNLRKFKNIPYGMACERSLDLALGFTRPKWEKLNPMHHLDLIRQIYMTYITKPAFIGDKVKWRNYIKSEIDNDRLTLEKTNIILKDKKEEFRFVRISNNGKCNEKEAFKSAVSFSSKEIYSVSGNLKKLLLQPKFGYGPGDLMIYKNRILTDQFYGAPPEAKNNIGIKPVLELDEVNPGSVGRLCNFYYYGKSAH